MPDTDDPGTSPPDKVWHCWPKGWTLDDMGCDVVKAPTRGAAIARSLRNAHDAGYTGLSFTDMRAVLAPKEAVRG